jgi:hypothetical protein
MVSWSISGSPKLVNLSGSIALRTEKSKKCTWKCPEIQIVRHPPSILHIWWQDHWLESFFLKVSSQRSKF